MTAIYKFVNNTVPKSMSGFQIVKEMYFTVTSVFHINIL